MCTIVKPNQIILANVVATATVLTTVFFGFMYAGATTRQKTCVCSQRIPMNITSGYCEGMNLDERLVICNVFKPVIPLVAMIITIIAFAVSVFFILNSLGRRNAAERKPLISDSPQL